MEWIKTVYAIFAIAPFFTFALIYAIVYFIQRESRQAMSLAMDITTFFLLGIVSVMYDATVNSSFRGWAMILLIMILTIAIIGNLQNRLKHKVDVKKLIHVTWRIHFFLLSLAYIILLFTGIIREMIV